MSKARQLIEASTQLGPATSRQIAELNGYIEEALELLGKAAAKLNDASHVILTSHERRFDPFLRPVADAYHAAKDHVTKLEALEKRIKSTNEITQPNSDVYY